MGTWCKGHGGVITECTVHFVAILPHTSIILGLPMWAKAIGLNEHSHDPTGSDTWKQEQWMTKWESCLFLVQHDMEVRHHTGLWVIASQDGWCFRRDTCTRRGVTGRRFLQKIDKRLKRKLFGSWGSCILFLRALISHGHFWGRGRWAVIACNTTHRITTW